MSAWRPPEELVELGFARSAVVMVNEFHDGALHCPRTREIGRRLLPVAHACGVRHLAMVALSPGLENDGVYLRQPDLRALADHALALGWTLVPYEDAAAGGSYREDGSIDWSAVNAREEGQASNLAAALPGAPVLVWCGMGHLRKVARREMTPMAARFWRLTGIEPFSIDQVETVTNPELVGEARTELEAFGGTAGRLVDDDAVDARIWSVDNAVV
jgi:hypothetical protein